MGLEFVELTLSVEDEFGVEISEHEAAEIGTVGAFYNLLLDRLHLTVPTAVYANRAFNLIRRTLVTEFSQPRSAIKTVVGLEPLFGNDRLVDNWSRFGRSLGLELPPLNKTFLSRERSVPVSCLTVRGTTLAVVSLNMPALAGQPCRQTVIWEDLQKVIVSSLGVSRDQVLLQHHFVHDLGCG